MIDQVETVSTFTWLQTSNTTATELAELEHSGIDTNALRRVSNKPTWPVLEVSGDQLFLALRTMDYRPDSSSLELNDVVFAVGPHILVTVCDPAASFALHMRNGLSASVENLGGSSLLTFHAALEMVIDSHLDAIEGLDLDIKHVEHQVFSDQRGDAAETIYRLLRAVTKMEQAIAPLAGEPLERLIKRKAPDWITTDVYRDQNGSDGIAELDRHLYRVVSRVRGLRALLDSILHANLTQVGLRQNIDMRRITAWVATASVPTVIAEIYGMNSANMPELTSGLGYSLALTLMAIAGATLFWRFRKSGWL